MDPLIQAWQRAAQMSEFWRKRETELRLQMAERFGPADKHEGTDRVPVDGGEVKIVNRYNYKIVDQEAVFRVMAQIPADLAAGLFKSEYKMSVTAYKQLKPSQQEWLANQGFLEIKPGLPEVEVDLSLAKDRVI